MTKPTIRDMDELTILRRIVRRWLMEELTELADATAAGDGSGVLDAIFDAMGILCFALALEPTSDVEQAFEAYVQSQLDRGRGRGFHHRAIYALMATVNSACIAEDAAEPRTALLTKMRQALQDGRWTSEEVLG